MPVPLSVIGSHQELPPALAGVLRESAARSVRSGQPDSAALSELRRSGVLATVIPAEYDGAGGHAAAVNRVIEQVASQDASVAIILFQHLAVCARICEWGSSRQKAALLPALAAGELLAASAWSESGAGAAKKKLGSTAAALPGGSWLLNGAKSFTTGAGIADIYLVLVQTSTPRADAESSYGAPGQSFFLISADNPGLVPETTLDLAGMRGSATGFISLRDCEVPDSARLGPLGQAPAIIAGVRESGATLGAVSVGIAQSLLDLAAAHAQRGAPSAAARYRLVESATQVEAARALVFAAGQRASANPGLTTLHSKIFASAVAEQVAIDVAGILGSSGYVVDHQLNRLIADARAIALMGPTNDLCRELVSTSWGI
jgi:alkylation response protein AidB-like acyl-CoA dehydrogenase